MAIPDSIRLAVFFAWYQRCAWCHQPINYDGMEVDHLIPQSLSGAKLEEALRLHGLPRGYDLQAARNLVASCARCNGIKGDRPPPLTPIISIFISKAARLETKIQESALKFTQDKATEKALATVRASMQNMGLDPAALDQLAKALKASPDAIETAAPGTTTVNLHPALSFILQPSRWSVSSILSDSVVVVTDGVGRGGYVGMSPGFACPFCGSHGPWNGSICMTCNQRSDPGD